MSWGAHGVLYLLTNFTLDWLMSWGAPHFGQGIRQMEGQRW